MMKIAGYEISDEDYAALAHVVLDPKGWIEHTASNFPPVLAAEHIANKIRVCTARWIADGRPSKTRAEREAEELAAMVPSAEQVKMQHELRLATLQVTLVAAKGAGLKLAQAQLEKDIAAIEAALQTG